MIGALQTLVAFCMCWLITSSLAIYPHSLSYFNESIGGPLNGPKHLLGSNVDWGQDLRYSKRWVEDNSNETVYLRYFGFFDPSDVAMANLEPGMHFDMSAYYLVSVSLFYGSRSHDGAESRWKKHLERLQSSGHSLRLTYSVLKFSPEILP